MRLAKREVRDADDLRSIVGQCRTLRLGLCDAEGPFIVPVSFGFEWAGDGDGACATDRPGDGGRGLTLWIHSAREGRKAAALRSGGAIAIEMDRELGIYSGDFSCTWSMAYESIMGLVVARETLTRTEKTHGLSLLMAHMAPGADVHFDDAALEATAVFALEVGELTGKRREAR